MNYYSVIFINMTQLNKIIKTVLAEQLGGRDAVFKQGPADPNAIKGPFNAQLIAKQIYDAKGTFSDSEEKVDPAFSAIKNIAQYTQVNKALQKLTDGRGIGEYLRSFLDVNARTVIASALMDKIPEAHWKWTIKQIVTWNDFRTVAAGSTNVYAKWKAGKTGVGEEKAILALMQGPYKQAWQWWANLTAGEQMNAWWKEDGHTILSTLQIVTAFIPIVGWAVSAGIGLVNAEMYAAEGDPKTAAITRIFAVIPGLGFAGKLGLSKVAPKLMANLGKKVALNQTKNLTKQEQWILSLLGKNQKALKTELDNYFRTGIMKSAKQLTKDKLAAGAKTLAFTGTKGIAGLASYMTIAKLYSNWYDSNQEQITQAELDKLNNQLDAELLKWIATKETSSKLESKQHSGIVLNEFGGLTWGQLAYGAGGLLLYKFAPGLLKKAKDSALIKNNTEKLFGIRKFYRDLRLYKQLGLDAKYVRSLYKSGKPLEDAKEQWIAIERQISTGELTDINAIMKQLPFLTRGGSKEMYDSIRDKLANKLKTATEWRTRYTDEIKRLQAEYNVAMKLGTREGTKKAKLLGIEITKLQSRMTSSSILTAGQAERLEQAGWEFWTKKMKDSGKSYEAMDAYLRKQGNKNWGEFAGVVSLIGMSSFVVLADKYARYREAEVKKAATLKQKKQGDDIQKALEKQRLDAEAKRKQRAATKPKKAGGGQPKVVVRKGVEPGDTRVTTPKTVTGKDTTTNAYD